MPRLSPTPSGHPTLFWGKTVIHSTYDPLKEARRFILETCRGENPSCFILLDPGLGYLIRAIRAQFPYSSLICLYFSDTTFQMRRESCETSWHPGADLSLAEFLRRHLHELDLEGLKIIEWPPITSLFPDEARTVRETLAQVLRELKGSLVTTGSMGRLWIRNTIQNFINLDSTLAGDICFSDKPIVIAASGPSLEECIPVLKECANTCNLWVLPSAIPAIHENGIVPDLVILTDPGYYSIAYLAPIKDQGIPVAMPLSAARGVWRITRHKFLLLQPNFFEKLLIEKTRLFSTRIPAMGTVAASALDLALHSTRREVVFCGLDLCYSDILSHARPSLQNTLHLSSSSRLKPCYSQAYSEAADLASLKQSGVRTSLSLVTYAGWFSMMKNEDRKRVYRYRPSGLKVENLEEIDEPAFKALIRSGKTDKERLYREPDPAMPTLPQRHRIARNLLREWFHTLTSAQRNIREQQTCRDIFLNRKIFDLSFFINLPDLLRLKRDARVSTAPKVLEQARALLCQEKQFLTGLLEKIGQIPQETSANDG